MALDSNFAVGWVIDILNADATLATLLGGANKVYRELIPDSVALPAIAVDIDRVGQRDGPIRSGPNTHAETPVRVQTSMYDFYNYTQIALIGARVDVLLDGRTHESTGAGEVIVCTHAGEVPKPSKGNSDPSIEGFGTLWDIAAKAA